MPVLPQREESVQEEPSGLTLPIDGEHRRRLDQLHEAIEAGRQAEAARQIGLWLQDVEIEDAFVAGGEEGREAHGFKMELRATLRGLSSEVRASYVTQFEPLARERLAWALERETGARLREVVMRFPFTPAAEEALVRLAHDHWDHARPRAALGCLARLRAEMQDPARFQPALALFERLCQHAAGWPQAALADVDELLRDHPTLTLAGAALRQQWPGTAGLPDQNQSLAAGWGLFGGDATRGRLVPARDPFLQPRWSRPLAEDPRTLTAIETSVEAHRAGRQTSLPMLAPLVAGGRLFVPTARGAAVYDVRSGECLWRIPGDDDGSNVGIQDDLWRQCPGGPLSADDRCLYMLEPPGGGLAARGISQVLVAREHAGGRQGNMRWRVGGPSGHAEPRLAGARFLGPPVPWHDSLYLLVEVDSVMRLAVLEASSGRLDWWQELGTVEEALAQDPLRLTWGAMPSISEAEDIIVCPTSLGAVVAVDLTTRSLVWAYRFSRQGHSDQESLLSESLPRSTQDGRWLDSTVVIARDAAVLAPPESHELHCLALADGRLIWKKPRESAWFVGAVAQEVVLVVGRSELTLLRLSDGEPAWPGPLTLPPGFVPGGRGLCTGGLYYLPLSNGGLLKVDLVEGRLEGHFKAPREQALGNLIWHEGKYISLSPTRLEVYDELAAVEIETQQRLTLDPHDAACLIRQGELDLASGRVDQAIAAFRKALITARHPRARSRLVSTLLDAVRAGHPESASFERELEQLASADSLRSPP
jgi:hypothetical protein